MRRLVRLDKCNEAKTKGHCIIRTIGPSLLSWLVSAVRASCTSAEDRSAGLASFYVVLAGPSRGRRRSSCSCRSPTRVIHASHAAHDVTAVVRARRQRPSAAAWSIKLALQSFAVWEWKRGEEVGEGCSWFVTQNAGCCFESIFLVFRHGRDEMTRKIRIYHLGPVAVELELQIWALLGTWIIIAARACVVHCFVSVAPQTMWRSFTNGLSRTLTI